jgi:4-aminobutyrate aminotransferase-like enzyme
MRVIPTRSILAAPVPLVYRTTTRTFRVMSSLANGAPIKKSITINTVPTEPTEFKYPTNILHRTPWRPPVGVSGEGSYITLEDGRTVYDAVGGAAVSCLGNSHPKVIKALKEQIDRVPCELSYQMSSLG